MVHGPNHSDGICKKQQSGSIKHAPNCGYLIWLPHPKDPSVLKNLTAPESVVFCYRRSFLLSMPFSCLFVL